jgi:hypothetical protein
MDKINLDLLIPLLIVCGLLRLKNLYNIPQKLLRGLRFFVPNSLISQKHLRPSPSDKSKQENDTIIDQKLDEFGLSMIELDGSTRKGSVLSEMVLYNVYDRIVYLSVSSFIIHCFSTIFHCYSPNSSYSIWGALFVAISVAVPFRVLIRILFMTGFKAFESRMALVASLVSFVVTVALLLSSMDFTGLSLDSVFQSTAIHCNALLLHLSTAAPQPPVLTMVAILKLILSLLSAITAAGMVIPALRFSQSFCNLQFGAKYERASVRTRLWLVFDHFLPLLVALDMIPYGLICSPFSTYIRGAPSERADGFWLGVQLLMIMNMVSVRLSCIRIYLQNFLDATVKAISIEILVSNQANAKEIQVCSLAQKLHLHLSSAFSSRNILYSARIPCSQFSIDLFLGQSSRKVQLYCSSSCSVHFYPFMCLRDGYARSKILNCWNR